jgi:hypothetical protein
MAKSQKKNKKKSSTAESSDAAASAPKVKKTKGAKKSDAAGGPAFKHVAKRRVSTGKGATAADIGKSLVELFNTGRGDEVKKLWHHKKIESIEADGTVFLGRKGVDEKDAWWYDAFEVHSAKADGPFVGATGFSVHFAIEVSPKSGDGAGHRTAMREVGVYTVEKGKIVREEFMALTAH